MIRKLLTPAICIFVGLTFSPVSAADVIGLSLPLEGRLTPVAQRMEFGARIAARKLNQSGQEVELALVNDGCDVEKVPETADSLEKSQAQIVVGPVCFRVAMELAKYAKQDNSPVKSVPIIALNTRNKLLTRLREVDELPLYSLSNAPDAEARAVVEMILPQFQDRPFALLDDGSVYGRALADDIRELSEQAGLRAVVNSNFRPLQTTQIAMLRRLRKSGVEAVFIAAAAEDVVTIANDIRTLKLNWMVATGERGQLLPYAIAPNSNMAGMMMVAERQLATDALREEIGDLGELELENSLLLGHAIVELAAEAIKRKLTDLSGATFETIIGPLTFDQSGRAAPMPFVLSRWRDGAFEIVRDN
ncbi:MAG: ABC transporter substrate-binding protein [Rhizobiaceae bacterium]|nr:ABC transporter substrate-binding protein [Rhizobiaceae bacterium]